MNLTKTNSKTNIGSRLFQPQHVGISGELGIAGEPLPKSNRLQVRQPRSDNAPYRQPLKPASPCKRSGLTPKPARPLSAKDRAYLRALRQAEMSLWLDINTAGVAQEQPAISPSIGALFRKLSVTDQRGEFVLLLALASLALVAIVTGFFHGESLVQGWAEFIHSLWTR